jgi:hypothetical protein
MTTAKDSQYWQQIIANLGNQIADNQTAIAALAEKKKPLCLQAHLGDKNALAEIEKIGIESRALAGKLPDLETAKEQAQAALQAAQQAEQHTANIARAEKMRDAVNDRLILCEKIDAAVISLVDLLVLDMEQRQKLSAITGCQFRFSGTYSLLRSALAFELLDKRGIRPDHMLLRLEHVDYRKPATDSVFCQGWIEAVNQRIDSLIGGDPAHKSLSVEEIEVELQKAA